MVKTTRTIGPLHFEDLEPHRFDDLVRQLIYDFRDWRTLEAVGRSGADEGIDIRGVEASESMFLDTDDEDETDAEEAGGTPTGQGDLWLCQVKREKEIGPKKVRAIVEAAIGEGEPPHGFLLAAACNFSAKARSGFREELVSRGVKEGRIWGKGELEDMLFRPSNDHLLFAYFGVSLQVRQRSLRTALVRRLATKRKLVKVSGDIDSPGLDWVLLRDPRADYYPFLKSAPNPDKPPWRHYQVKAHYPPDHITFIVNRYFAYIDPATGAWDCIADFDLAAPPAYVSGNDASLEPQAEWRFREFWIELPDENQAYLEILGTIHYDRVMLVDDIGDKFNKAPHLLVEYSAESGPFDSFFTVLDPVSRFGRWVGADDADRVDFFPDEIPEGPKDDEPTT